MYEPLHLSKVCEFVPPQYLRSIAMALLTEATQTQTQENSLHDLRNSKSEKEKFHD